MFRNETAELAAAASGSAGMGAVLPSAIGVAVGMCVCGTAVAMGVWACVKCRQSRRPYMTQAQRAALENGIPLANLGPRQADKEPQYSPQMIHVDFPEKDNEVMAYSRGRVRLTNFLKVAGPKPKPDPDAKLDKTEEVYI